MKKIVIAAAVVLIAGLAGYFGYDSYQQAKFTQAATPFVKNSSLRLANGLRYEVASSAGITFRELFSKLEENIAETEKNILQIQTISTPAQKKLADPIITYLQCAQEIQRILVSKYRKHLAAQSALERAQEAVRDLASANRYTRDVYERSSSKALEEASNAANEGKEAMVALAAAAERMKDLADEVREILSADAIIDTSTLDSVIENNKPDDAKDSKGA